MTLKTVMLIMKSGKKQITEGIELPNQERIKTPKEKENFKYLGILEADTIKQAKMKEKITKKYHRRTRKLLESKLSGRNLIKGLNTWIVPLIRYSRSLLKWAKEDKWSRGQES